MDLLLYWFMFPVALVVATLAMSSGIGGAAMFTPIFLLIFPLLGPRYPLQSAAAAIGVSLAIEVFGFGSGVIGYFRRRLIHLPTALRILRVAIPAAIIGSLLAHWFDPAVVRIAYAVLMLILAYVLVRGHEESPTPFSQNGEEDEALDHLTDDKGNEYHFRATVTPASIAITSSGAFLTGLVSVGIGEVTVSQLSRRSRVPLPVATGTSVFVVAITVLISSLVHLGSMLREGGLNAVPLNLLLFAIPGVLIGGMIGSKLQAYIPKRKVELGISALFLLIGLLMAASAFV